MNIHESSESSTESIHSFWNHSPTLNVFRDTKTVETEWRLRCTICNFFGITDEMIEEAAKEEYLRHVQQYRGKGCTGNEKWEDAAPWVKFYWINGKLPELQALTNINGSPTKYLIASVGLKPKL